MSRCFTFAQSADGVFNDVVNDVGGCVIDASGFFDFGLWLDNGSVAGSQADYLTEELLIDVAEYFCGQDGEFVRAFGIIQAAEEVLEVFIVDSDV